MDDRTLKIAVLVAAHAIFLSAGALRILRGRRGHQLTVKAPWWIQYYPPLVWLPFLVAYFQPFPVDLDQNVQFAGLALGIVSALFAAWAMWSLGKSYGIRMDIFEGHRLVTGGPYAIVRHPMYLGIVLYHVGATLVLQSPLLLALTALVIAPYTAIRIAYEERALREAFGERYAVYQAHVPALLPLVR